MPDLVQRHGRHGGVADDAIQQYLARAFALHLTENEAAETVVAQVEASAFALSKQIKDASHELSIAQKGLAAKG